MMMIDLDNLKRINDRQGHRGGDAALRLAAQQLQRVVRASDLCARIGGDEFAVAMPETDIERGREVVARLRAAVREMSLGAKSVDAVEVSVGLAECGQAKTGRPSIRAQTWILRGQEAAQARAPQRTGHRAHATEAVPARRARRRVAGS